MRYYFKSHNLIGDALYISPAWRQWIKEHNYNLDKDVIFMDTLPDHIAPLYQGMIRDLVPNLLTVHHRPVEEAFDFEHVFNINKAFSLSDQKKQHCAQSYADLLNVTLPGEGNIRYKPIYIPDYKEDGLTEREWNINSFNKLQGCILVSMFSASCTSRDKEHPNQPPNKMLPWDKWIPLINLLRESFPNTLIRFVGAPADFVPNGYAKGIVQPGEYMTGIPLNRLALIMKHAKLLVTIDNGMGHLAATQETPTFLMYPRCLGPHYIVPVGNPNLINWVHIFPVYVDPKQLVYSLKYAIKKIKEKE